MKTKFAIAALTLLICACGHKYEFWDISKFTIDNEALAEYEKVQILYSSQGPYHDEDALPFYTHLLVVSLATGDTVNILTPTSHELSLDQKDQIFHFLKQDNVATKLIQMNADEINNVKDINDLANQPAQIITKVSRDPKFDFLADNNYPSIIGIIVTVHTNLD